MLYEITKRCIKCGACESECPNNAVIEDEKQFRIDEIRCRNCGNCIDNCPNNAIIEKR
ncbi:MAG: 4Fe-4S binding protein [Firmicutes bacterium]|nr:4Fe-4S binding protein [Bacillota bacterium]